jgi:alpha-L-rhamnosidase
MSFGTILLLSMAATSGMQPSALRCEYHANPLGIDATRPRLGWQSVSSRRGEMQTAYQIIAADSEKALQPGKADLWDSGKVVSDRSTQIAYGGKPLHSREHVWWRVRVWDRDGNPSGWSAPAAWEMGLLAPQDWQARWIGHEKPQEANAAEDTRDIRWIWFPEGNPRQEGPKGSRYFRAEFRVPDGKTVKRADLIALADNDYSAAINGKAVGTGSGWASLNPTDVTKSIAPGRNLLSMRAYNESGPAGLAALLKITYTDGTAQRIASGSTWKTATEAAPGWQTVAFADDSWKSALVLTTLGEGPWGAPAAVSGEPGPVPYLRKTFQATRPIRQARLYVTALGLYELYVNGQHVGSDLFRPGWTDFSKRVPYQTIDLTRQLKTGANALGLTLGDGWFSGYVGFGRQHNHYGTQNALLAQLEVEYADGTHQTVVTDGSWRASSEGPLRFSDMLMGEEYDATREMPGWNKPEFDDAKWAQAIVMETPAIKTPTNVRPRVVSACPGGVNLVAQAGPSVHRVLTITPKSVTEKPAGTYIYDLGQNMVGWVRLRVSGKAGSRVTLRFAEMLNPDGTIYTTNLRSARATDVYTLRGGGVEVYEPSFTFHGFRYVEVTGLPSKPGKETLTGIVLSSVDLNPEAFVCSNPLVNQLQHNIQWGQRSNYFEVPTDCPQRDERLGWMGDAQIFVRTGCFNADIAAFMNKWMDDVEDAQSAAGGFPDVAPRLVDPSDGAPAWGDAGIIVPWTIYACYGDTRILERHYDAMARWVAYIQEANPDLLWRNRANNNFGDWLSINADTPKDVLATAYFAYDASLMTRIAHALGRTEDERKYAALFIGIKAAFNKAFVTPDGRIKGNTQCDYVVALRFDLLPANLRPLAAQHLVDDIRMRGDHLSTGFVGVGYLTPTLTATGHLDTAYALLLQDTFPSWGYSIRQGATTIWERWDGWTTDKGFQDPGMNSFNHYSLGSVGEWLYTNVGGIDLDPDRPGYKHILLHPQPGGDLTFARSTLDSLYGKIVSDWAIGEGTFRYHVEVPVNTVATVYVPTRDATQVREAEALATTRPGIKFLRTEQNCAVYELGSGSYRFTAPR